MKAVISSTGLWTPEESITNEELVESFNAYVDIWNSKNSSSIIDGKKLELTYSDAGFIEKASGVKSRYTISKKSILDPNIMAPRIPKRKNSEPSILAEIGFKAAQDALTKTNRNPKDIDAIICACSNLQRGYPAIAVEIQNLLGAQGFAFDMNVACSSATFGIETARCLISGGQAKTVLVINPEICTAHLNFKDRDSHFIFGDVATATLIESDEVCEKEHWEIISSKLITEFSNNIRNSF
jgi:beta-ketodecanoyl-[acyl-carrier-protein] synthase